MDFQFSIIIPHRNTISLLPKLLSTIPDLPIIEIIIVDNSDVPISKKDINVSREFCLLYSQPFRGAGGARNVGLQAAHGKWLIFADADDYFTPEAFDAFLRHMNLESDIVFFSMSGIYLDTGKISDRGDRYTKMIFDYQSKKISELYLRINWDSPCSKMIRTEFVRKNCFAFDEVVASNDAYFSLLSGYYANKISVSNSVVYIATVNKGSLTKRRDINVFKSRYFVCLRINKFLRDHKLYSYQRSIMYYLFKTLSCYTIYFPQLFLALIKYKQNPFIGWKRWILTYKHKKKTEKNDSEYIINK